jgi:hypothetical protein
MNMATYCPIIAPEKTALCPLAETRPRPVETRRNDEGERGLPPVVIPAHRGDAKDGLMGEPKSDEEPPAPTLSGPPEKELEKKLKRDPEDLDAKADVGSDESMDASDPSSATQPGQDDKPVPSSSFPE